MKYIRPILITAILIGIIGLGVYGVAYKLPSRTVTWTSKSTGEQSGNVGTFFRKLLTKSEITLVVFGKPGFGYGGGELADAILVARLNPNTKIAHLVSLPRDLWVSLGDQQFKINELFIKNRVAEGITEIEKITGLTTDGYVVVDLTMLKNAVDWLGGIDITLNAPATDWVSGYTLPAGQHHLNGEDAVWLVRNRYSQQGDFFRESNQHGVIEAMAHKFQILPNDQKTAFLKTFVFKGAFLQNAKIDFSKITPYLFGGETAVTDFKSIVLDFTTKLFKTTPLPIQGIGTTTYISTLIPTAGFEQYKDIRAYIEQKMRE